jgi:hypothetical protein
MELIEIQMSSLRKTFKDGGLSTRRPDIEKFEQEGFVEFLKARLIQEKSPTQAAKAAFPESSQRIQNKLKSLERKNEISLNNERDKNEALSIIYGDIGKILNRSIKPYITFFSRKNRT